MGTKGARALLMGVFQVPNLCGAWKWIVKLFYLHNPKIFRKNVKFKHHWRHCLVSWKSDVTTDFFPPRGTWSVREGPHNPSGHVYRQLKNTCAFNPGITSRHLLLFFPTKCYFYVFWYTHSSSGKKKSMVLFSKIGRDSEYRFPSPLYEVFLPCHYGFNSKMVILGAIRSHSWCYHHNQWYTFIYFQRNANWFLPDEKQRSCFKLLRNFFLLKHYEQAYPIL